MTVSEILSYVTFFVVVAAVIFFHVQQRRTKQATRLCVTLKDNEGEFIGLLTEKHRKRWTFEQCQLMPSTRSEAPVPVDGRLHLHPSNVLYYQQLPAKGPEDASK